MYAYLEFLYNFHIKYINIFHRNEHITWRQSGRCSRSKSMLLIIKLWLQKELLYASKFLVRNFVTYYAVYLIKKANVSQNRQ